MTKKDIVSSTETILNVSAEGQKSANVPNLRFGQYTSEWRKNRLETLVKMSKGYGITKDQLSAEGAPCILYGELYTTYHNEVISVVKSKTDIDTKGLVYSQVNDVIIPSSGETPEDIATACCVMLDDVLLGGDLNILRPHKDNGCFLSYQLNGKRKYDIARVAQGASIVHLHNEHLRSMSIYAPETLEEQEKIVDLLSLIDERIETQSKIIEDLIVLKKWFIHRYYTERNHTSKGKFCDYITQISTRNKTESVTDVLSVSNKNGFVRQNEQFEDREIASDDKHNYKIVKKDDFAYNPARINVGSIARLKNFDVGIVSPMYVCFRTNQKVLPEYLEYYFQSITFFGEMKKRLEGSVRQCLSYEALSGIKIFIPSLDEQKEVIKKLNSVENKIELEKQILINYQYQKKYLLSQMFI